MESGCGFESAFEPANSFDYQQDIAGANSNSRLHIIIIIKSTNYIPKSTINIYPPFVKYFLTHNKITIRYWIYKKNY